MEVSGRKESSVRLCQPCQRDGDTVQAEGYCDNCNEFICSSCIKAHRKLATTKYHVIKSEDEMPRYQTQTDPCTELCDVHVNEIVKFYCQEHDSVGCGDCMVLQHTSCKVQLVSDVSSNYGFNVDLDLIKHRIDNLRKNLVLCKEEIKCSLEAADQIKTEVVKEIKLFSKEMDNYLDKMEADLLQKVEEMNDRDVSSQKKLQGQCEALSDEMKEFQRKLDQCKYKVNNLFVTSKRVQRSLEKCQKINETISAKSQINTLNFKVSEGFDTLKKHKTPFGSLETKVKTFSGQCKKCVYDVKAHFVNKVNCQAKNEGNCFITGITFISEAEILLADRNNESLKILNYRDNKVTSTLKLSDFSTDITKISSSSAATCIPHEGKIVFLNTQNGLTESHSLNVRKGCVGINHRNGILAVAFLNPPAVQVLDMEGQILHEVRDTSILKYPMYVYLSTDNKYMFVSDSGSGVVYKFTLQGELVSQWETENNGTPAGLTVTNCGCAVVCYAMKSDLLGVIVPVPTKPYVAQARVSDLGRKKYDPIDRPSKRLYESDSGTDEMRQTQRVGPPQVMTKQQRPKSHKAYFHLRLRLICTGILASGGQQ
ncbi:uncharacterized protein LOC132737322 [Ruditapes philippinarum]|uniref:uncharacterized protein LOC132737322 n=1 Tax=Ruditapes philippinarum TaxID=129788 RepID=UPI00295A6BE4|nr:uncharacterized protein LOC132737322 [Ruditapes philippinarum]